MRESSMKTERQAIFLWTEMSCIFVSVFFHLEPHKNITYLHCEADVNLKPWKNKIQTIMKYTWAEKWNI